MFEHTQHHTRQQAEHKRTHTRPQQYGRGKKSLCRCSLEIYYVYCFIIAPTNMHNIYLCKWLYICNEATMARFSQPRKRLRSRSDSVLYSTQHNTTTIHIIIGRYIYSFLYSISVAILGSVWATTKHTENRTPFDLTRTCPASNPTHLRAAEDAGPG